MCYMIRKKLSDQNTIDSIGVYKDKKTLYSAGTTFAESDPDYSGMGVFGLGDGATNETTYSFVEATEYGRDVDEIYLHQSNITELVLVKKTDGMFYTIGRNTSYNLRGIQVQCYCHIVYVSNLYI